MVTGTVNIVTSTVTMVTGTVTVLLCSTVTIDSVDGINSLINVKKESWIWDSSRLFKVDSLQHFLFPDG